MDLATHAKLPGKAGIFLHYGAILGAIVVAREMEGSRVALYSVVTVLLGGMAVAEMYLGHKTYTPNDVKNMEMIRQQMEDMGFLKFVREHNFLDNYREDKLDPLRRFSDLDQDSFFFDDPKLASDWRELKDALDAFAHMIYTWHTPPEYRDVCGFVRELRERSNIEEGFLRNPESAENLARRMNDLSVEVHKSYLTMRGRYRGSQVPREQIG